MGASWAVLERWKSKLARSQPRVTSKTGWVTLHADPSPRRRAQMQIAACLLGIAVCEATAEQRNDSWGAPPPGRPPDAG